MRLTLVYLQLYVVVALFSVTEALGNDPDLAEYYASMQVSDLQLDGDSIDKVFQKLTERMRQDRKGIAISTVLVKPSKELLQQHITKKFHNQALKDILEELCVLAGLHYALDHHVIMIGANGVDLSKKSLRMEPPRRDEMQEIGMRIVIPKLEFAGTDFMTAANTIKEQSTKYNATGKPFIIQFKLHLVPPEPKVYAWFPLAVSGEAIEYICMSAGLRYSSPSDGVYILMNK